MPLRLFNTLSRSIEPFRPLIDNHVRIYVCGLTPSAEGHVGHARSFLFFDVLRRYLEHPHNGYRVTFVKNVTDIDDRSIATAQREGTTYGDVTGRYYRAFEESMRRLDVRDPDIEPFATHSIPEIQAMIDLLVGRGHAYPSRDGIYFSVASFPRYGKLSGKKIDELLVGARIEENEDKRNPLDFALWKFARGGEPAWPWRTGSPNAGSSGWTGRPGWHIECSAMIAETFGLETIDIHGGGYDLIFPHHENEIAQSESLMPHPLARFWLHGGLLNYNGRKMSKSLGNFEPLSALLDRQDPYAIRLLFLQTGYRKPMNFTEESIAGATIALDRLRRGAREMRGPAAGGSEPRAASAREALRSAQTEFFAALDNDMDTSRALSVLFTLDVHSMSFASAGIGEDALRQFREYAEVLGLGGAFTDARLNELDARVRLSADFIDRIAARLRDVLPMPAPELTPGAVPESVIQAVIDARTAARRDKNFALGDRLRDALAAEGIALKDSKDGTTWTAVGV